MVLVQATAIDTDDDLRSRRVERATLEHLDRLAANLPTEMTSARRSLVAAERGLVRRASRQDEQPAKTRRTRRAQRDRIGCTANDYSRRHAGLHGQLVVEQQRALGVELDTGLGDQGGRVARELEPELALRIGKDGANLNELGDKPTQARIDREAPQRERDTRVPLSSTPSARA